ncbi:MAG: cysteine desulfurase [Candidatus Pacebacteria bacterium]|nr:cysteine desulfurase [Candidatus Paceibacterota bacterium]
MGFWRKKKRIFLDYASTTPVLLEVKRAMGPYFSEHFGNPATLYQEGIDAKKAVEQARKKIARILGSRSEEIIFTGSGTESANLALWGVINSYQGKKAPHIVTTTIEHPAVREVAKAIKAVGGNVTLIHPNENGLVTASSIREALREETILVSVMYANNEIGTVNPIREIGKVIREYKEEKGTSLYFHTDASQAPNYLPLNVSSLGVDLMTLDASKVYGPKGVGMLYARRGTRLLPIMYGGGQEYGLRSGTENVAGIVGMAVSLEMATRDREKEAKYLSFLRDYAIEKILKQFPKASLNGSCAERLPNNINICIPGMNAEFAVYLLDALGISVAYASSCRTLAEGASSYVIEALSKKECAVSSLRITMGRGTRKNDIDVLLKALPSIVLRAR